MDTLTIKCNNVPRNVLRWYDLTDKERKEFDYLDTDDKQMEAEFVRYRGWCYHTSDFMRISHSQAMTPQMIEAGFDKFDGYASDSFFSGVLLRYAYDGTYRDWERVIMATYYS